MTSRAGLTLTIVGTLALSTLLWSANTAHAAGATIPNRISGATSQVDPDSAFAKTLKQATILKAGSAADFKGYTASLYGQTVDLRMFIDETFVEQRQIVDELAAYPKALFGPIRVETEVYETKYTFVIRQATFLPILDPELAATVSPTYKSTLGSVYGTVLLSDLNKDQLNYFQNVKSMIVGFPTDHPLRMALKQGDQHLLDTVSAGIGESELVDTVIVSKTDLFAGGQLMIPAVRDGAVDYSDLVPASTTAWTETLPPSPHATSTVKSGERSFSANFLNGFTKGYDFNWEKRWGLPVLGFFRFTVGAHAGFGVRIPIQISGKASPTYIYRLEYEDAVDTFLTELKAETLDADAAFFKSTGLPDHKNFDGDEIFASMGVGYGYKLHVLGFDVLYKKYKEWQVGPRWDVDPPLSGTLQTISSYFIPWQVTNTGFDLGILWGSVRIGAKLENRATIDADFSPYIEDQSTGERKYTYCTDNVNAHWPADGNRVAHGATSGCEVTFGDETTLHPFVSQIPRYIYSEGHDYDYGFELKRLSYASEWALTPGLKFNLGIGYSWWGFDYTKNFWIDSLRWYIAHIRLGTHAGTQATQNIDVGTKYYRVPDR